MSRKPENATAGEVTAAESRVRVLAVPGAVKAAVSLDWRTWNSENYRRLPLFRHLCWCAGGGTSIHLKLQSNESLPLPQSRVLTRLRKSKV